jgi:hypothetical protein
MMETAVVGASTYEDDGSGDSSSYYYDLVSSYGGGLSPPQLVTTDENVSSHLSYAWSLFDDIDFADNDDICVPMANSISGYGDDSGLKRKYVAGAEDHTDSSCSTTTPFTTPSPTTTKSPDDDHDHKRAKQGDIACTVTDITTSSSGSCDIYSAVNFIDPAKDAETFRIRAILEARARAILVEHIDKSGTNGETLQLVPNKTIPSTHGYDPLQYFRMMTAAINVGCYSDMCVNINRFFTADCAFRAVAIPVHVYGLLVFIWIIVWNLSVRAVKPLRFKI